MTRSRYPVVLAALLLFAAAPSGAAVELERGAVVGPGYFASDNVTLVGHVPLNNDSAGMRIRGKYAYVTSSHSLRIYDISDPVNPVLTGFLPGLKGTPYFPEEDPDTNGKILLREDTVIDVSNPASPQVLATHTANAHTISCILECTWAYNSSGGIIDLRNPAQPVVSTRSWFQGTPVTSSHDVTEVAPGFVLTASDPVVLLDVREDPTRPKVIASGPRENRFNHSSQWANSMGDRWALIGGEAGGATCATSPSARFTTWDTLGWDDPESPNHGKLRLVDTFQLPQGLPTDGRAPTNRYCTHWFSAHPDFDDGGYVAMAWYEHGARFLQVQPDGKIKEVGWIMAFGSQASAAYWVTKEIVYVTDYHRGFDIVRFTPPAG